MQEQHMLDVSVIVCTKNAEFNIEDCLKSIKENEPREIILVDGHSTDKTVEIAKKYTTVILHDLGRGLAVARNIGLDHASGKYICYVGPDNIMPPGSISRCVLCLEENDYAGVSAVTLIANPEKNYLVRALNTYKKARYFPGERPTIGTPWLYKAEILKEFRFDSQVTYSDGVDLTTRLDKQGYKMAIADTIIYETGYESIGSIARRWWMYGTSDFEYYTRYSPGWKIRRKVYSLTHPLRNELIYPFLKTPGTQRVFLLPFLVLITSIRYTSWFIHWARSKARK